MTRGICPVCHRRVMLLADGRIGKHGSTAKGQSPPSSCPGWGQFSEQADKDGS